MYNNILNGDTYNSTAYPLLDTISDDIIFNGLGFMNDKIRVSFKDDQNLPITDLVEFSNPVIDGGGILNRRYSEKTITFRGTIKGVDNTELLQLIDLFKLKTSKIEGFLDIKHIDTYRRVKATVISNEVFPMEHYNINWTNFTISFKTVEPFFYDVNSEVYTDTGITGDRYMEFTYNGTATSNMICYIVFGTTVGTDEIILSLGDKKITISDTIPSNSIVVLDGINKIVKIGNDEIDYTGRFPTLENGSNQILLGINGTMSCDVTIIYKNKYL